MTGLGSGSLLGDAIRGEDVVHGGSETLDDLIEVGLLTEAEKRELENQRRMAQLVWIWINRLGRDKLVERIEAKQVTRDGFRTLATTGHVSFCQSKKAIVCVLGRRAYKARSFGDVKD